VAKRVFPEMQSRRYGIPHSFLNSTIALVMVSAGFVVYELLVTQTLLTFNMLICSVGIAFNLSIVLLWSRLQTKTWWVKNLFFIMAIQWSWVCYAVIRLYSDSSYSAALLVAACGCLLIWMAERQRRSPLFSTIVFSSFGVLAMGFIIWRGLGDWSISTAAKGRSTAEIQIAEVESMDLSKSKNLSGNNESAQSLDWSYEGETGPDKWGQLSPDFEQCMTGLNQSPIDIPRHAFLTRNWLKGDWKTESGKIFVDGKSIRLDLAGKSRLHSGKKNFQVKKLYIHSPSEHQLSGFSYPMELQLLLENNLGENLAVAIFVEIGEENQQFEKVITKLQSHTLSGENDVNELNMSQFFPKDLSAYRYQGSLTIPPCTEALTWNVVRSPVEFSSEQISKFRKMFSNNSRPIQSFDKRKFEVLPARMAH
jgi:carbonic anhydrase